MLNKKVLAFRGFRLFSRSACSCKGMRASESEVGLVRFSLCSFCMPTTTE